MSEAEFQPDKITILEVKIIKGEIDSPFEFDTDEIVGHDFKLDYEVGFNVEEKLAKADFKVEIETNSEGNVDEAKSYFHIVYIFKVDNLLDLTSPIKKSDEIEVNGSLGNALASITYSTTRGMLLTRFQGTALSSFLLPVIDPNELLTSDKK